MTELVMGKNERADLQVVVPIVETNYSGSVPLGVTNKLPFEEVKDLIASGRAPKRPNRNRPRQAPSLEELLELARENPPPQEFFDGDADCPW